MTRAQIADPDLIAKLRAGAPDRIRPCTRCNQTCQVRDVRNPLVTCIGEPSSGHETEDPDWYTPAATRRSVVVVGGGPAGLETARVAAIRGHTVTLVERASRLGGLAGVAGPNEPLVAWLAREVARLGVDVQLEAVEVPAGADAMIQCTGSVAGKRGYEVGVDAVVVDVAELRRGEVDLPAEGDVVVFDPIGGPIGVALAEELGAASRPRHPGPHRRQRALPRRGSGPGRPRLARVGVRIERRTLLRGVRPGEAEVEDRFTGIRRIIPCAAVVDCGFRLPDEPLSGATAQAGDCVAPRTVHEAILEGRRVARAL